MFATGDYERFYCDVLKRYDDIDISITFGVLIADYDQRLARDYIINYLDIFNKNSGEYIDFFIPGYIPYNNGDSKQIALKNKMGENYFFSRDVFHKFIEEFKTKFRVDYPYNPILVLVELSKDDFSNARKIIIELDIENRNIKKTGVLFDRIFEIAKKHTEIDKFESGLVRTYIKGECLDSFLRVLDSNIVTEVVNNQKNIRLFKIK